MNPEQIRALSQPPSDLYEQLTTELMEQVAEQLSTDDQIADADQWRLKKIAEVGVLSALVIQTISTRTADCPRMTEVLLKVTAAQAVSEVEPMLLKASEMGFTTTATDVSASARVSKVLHMYQAQAKSTYNLVNTVMTYKSRDAYTGIVNKVADLANRQEYLDILGRVTGDVVTGQQARTAALRQCIKEFSEKGLPGFVDKAGREWSPEAYINMDIRTTVNNVAHATQFARMDDYGSDLIMVSSHIGARPRCEPFQGKLYSRSGKSGFVEDLSGSRIAYTPWSSTSYGEAAGLLGINCGHWVYPFFPGFSRMTHQPYPKERNDKAYAQGQQQRSLERKVKASRRECAMLDKLEDKEGFSKAAATLKQRERALKDFTSSTGRRYKSDRIQVNGFGRSVSGKAVWAERVVEKQRKEAYNKSQEIRDLIRSDKTNKKINPGQQSKHIKGMPGYIPGRSCIYGDLQQAQALVEQYAGTGQVKFNKSGGWTNKEFILSDHKIGVVVDFDTGVETETARFSIHYGKHGTHIVPAKELNAK